VAVTVVSVSSLPKMDVMGKCDPFLKVAFRGKEHATKVVKNTLDAVFEETFEFEVADARAEQPDLTLTLLDWDRLSAADTVAPHLAAALRAGRRARRHPGPRAAAGGAN